MLSFIACSKDSGVSQFEYPSTYLLKGFEFENQPEQYFLLKDGDTYEEVEPQGRLLTWKQELIPAFEQSLDDQEIYGFSFHDETNASIYVKDDLNSSDVDTFGLVYEKNDETITFPDIPEIILRYDGGEDRIVIDFETVFSTTSFFDDLMVLEFDTPPFTESSEEKILRFRDEFNLVTGDTIIFTEFELNYQQ